VTAPLLETTVAALRRRVADGQRDGRAASVVCAVVRDGQQVFAHGVGLADVEGDLAAGPDVQYRIGSITKTFTAALVLALRDEGLLSLDDPLGTHLPGTRHGAVTVRQLLTHLSGLQREPVGDVWWTMQPLDPGDLVPSLEEAESVSVPHRRWHYSNLAYAVLGELVARLDRRPWEQSLQARVLDPLGMARTALAPTPPRAVGYLTDPYADLLHREPDAPTGGLAPAAQLWSTVTDLGRWASFWADPVPEVLSADTVEEMCHPHVMWDVDAWTLGWGLGLMLLRDGDRVLAGHEGAMPGFLAAMWVRRQDRVGAVALANATSSAAPGPLAAGLVDVVLTAEPPDPQAWRPGPPVDEAAAQLLGRWWSEGSEFVFGWHGGHLEARVVGAPATRPPAVFAPEGDDRWRTVSGRETGELLRVVRDGSGAVVRMHWATYGFTRDARVFGAPGPDPAP
jgi:CubicO group peptidase (beta-lactamase class C family)